MEYFFHYVVFVVMTLLHEGVSLLCYECVSTKNPSCGRYFDSTSHTPVNCEEQEGSNKTYTCAAQRQTEHQFSILRGCYPLNLIPGLNDSNGCRMFMNPSNNYSALYCFCNTDNCNDSWSIHKGVSGVYSLHGPLLHLALCATFLFIYNRLIVRES
ncbi:unnamed protein product [Owenia fusiformis]|uniref:Uncharacterized protein n=1 Tax=Owenia fusiformis TaxID=6347 RepID=A0A8J1UEQ7_OWEFU|nr:unnamed protein product [Owenia fusiformis]